MDYLEKDLEKEKESVLLKENPKTSTKKTILKKNTQKQKKIKL